MARETPDLAPPAGQPGRRPAPALAVLSLLWPLLWVLVASALTLGAAGAALRWLLFTEAGAHWVLRQVDGLQVQGLEGSLLGERLRADHLRWEDGQGRVVQVQAPDLQGVRWHALPQRGAWVSVEITQLSADRVMIATGPPSGQPLSPPRALRFPLQLTLQQLALSELQVDALPPMQSLTLQGLALDGTAGGMHRLQAMSLHWREILWQASADLAASAPLPLTLELRAAPLDATAPPWAATLTARGPLERLDVSATLRGQPGPRGEPGARLDAQARVAAFSAWPVTALDLQAARVDLRALQRGAPQTRIGGQVQVRAASREAPLQIAAQLDNSLPGRWDAGRVPVRQLQLQALGSLTQPDTLELPGFKLDLGDASGPKGSAGRMQGRATWLGTRLALEATLSDLEPQRLDSRATAMQLSGPVGLVLDGVLPSPDPQADRPAVRPAPRGAIDLSLRGRVEGAPLPVQLELQAEGGARQLRITRLQAEAGAARAEAEATLQRLPGGDWDLQTQGALRRFDPVPWWPGAAGSAWRQGPHRVSASWSLQLRVPRVARGQPAMALLPRLQGNGELQVTDSLLAGVPVSGEVMLGYTPAARTRPGTLHAEFDIGGNRIVLDGQGNPEGSGAQDQLLVQLSASQIATLAPLARLHPQTAAWAPESGSLQGSVSAGGRWPELRTEGSFQVRQLRAGPLALGQSLAAWRLDSSGEAPLLLEATVEDLRVQGQTVSLGRATLRGNAARHRIEFELALPVTPPAVAGLLLDVPPREGTQVVLRADGGWTRDRDGDGGGRWTARVERLGLQPWGGEALDAASPASVRRWAELRDFGLALELGPEGGLQALEADAGQIQLAELGRLRWDRVRVDLRPARPQLELNAVLEPVRVAPLMARFQPGTGWTGDLRLGARLKLRAAETFEADLALHRHDGDLHIEGQAGVQLLGLEELLLTLTARDGVWESVQTFRGRSLGEISGRQRLRTTADRRWPERSALIQGGLEARVADAGIWSNWVPPGWRLAGELLLRARLSGSLASPQVTGRISGQGLAARNLLQGVNVTDGVMDVALEGDRARIESFTLRAGEGELSLSGQAALGRRPALDLALTADRFRVLGRVDRQLVASGQAQLRLTGETIRLDGRLQVDQGLFDASRSDAPGLDSDVTVQRADTPSAPTPPAEPTPRRDIRMALDLDLGQDLRVRGRGLDTAVRGQLRLSMPAGRLALQGIVSTERGTYAAYGQKLEIERGIIAFTGPPENPRLDVLALRPNTDVRVGVAITGNLQNLRVRLFSDPELTDNEKLSWLLLGREPDGLGRTDTALLQRAAVALLSGEGESATDAILRGLGIDDFSLGQSDADSRETVVRLGKQLGRRWYLGYERGVNAAAGTWQLIYRVAQRITVRAQSGLENSLDIIWSWRVGEVPQGEAGRSQEVVAVPPPPPPPPPR
jgi:translocation and assembly module TamB